MTQPLTDAQLDEIRERVKLIPKIGYLVTAHSEAQAMAVHQLKTDIPLLLAEIERLKTTNDTLFSFLGELSRPLHDIGIDEWEGGRIGEGVGVVAARWITELRAENERLLQLNRRLKNSIVKIRRPQMEPPDTTDDGVIEIAGRDELPGWYIDTLARLAEDEALVNFELRPCLAKEGETTAAYSEAWIA